MNREEIVKQIKKDIEDAMDSFADEGMDWIDLDDEYEYEMAENWAIADYNRIVALKWVLVELMGEEMPPMPDSSDCEDCDDTDI